LISKESSLKPLGQMNRNLIGSIIGRSSIEIAHLVPMFRFIWQSGCRGEDFLEINQSETRLFFGGHVCYQINRNLVGIIFERSSIKTAHLVPICLQTWPPQAILVSDWLISKKSSPLKPLG
jgi:hypothetical protein